MAIYLYNSTITALSLLQEHFTFIYPSYVLFCLLKTFQILSFHCSGFSQIFQNTLDTSSINLSLDMIRCTTRCQNMRKLFEFTPNSFPLCCSCLLHTTTGTNIVCHPDNKILVHIPPSHKAQSQPFSTPLSEHNISCNGDQHNSSIYQRCHCTFYEPICYTYATHMG